MLPIQAPRAAERQRIADRRPQITVIRPIRNMHCMITLTTFFLRTRPP